MKDRDIFDAVRYSFHNIEAEILKELFVGGVWTQILPTLATSMNTSVVPSLKFCIGDKIVYDRGLRILKQYGTILMPDDLAVLVEWLGQPGYPEWVSRELLEQEYCVVEESAPGVSPSQSSVQTITIPTGMRIKKIENGTITIGNVEDRQEPNSSSICYHDWRKSSSEPGKTLWCASCNERK